jgi:hypothetical protein
MVGRADARRQPLGGGHQADAPPFGADFARKPMVEWYHPWTIFKTGFQVAVWEFVGQSRPMEERPRSFRIHRAGQREVWFDYAADTGDGWNPTFAMASLMAQPVVRIGGRRLRRGAFLLLGGDEVYPVPSEHEYRERFVQPFSAALPDPPAADTGHRRLLAIPGNHDWYDGLVSFTREFTQRRRIGGWRTIQNQSYFAVELPHHWWLWAMDVRPGTRMDHGQRTYFDRAAQELREGHRVILVAAVPEWVTQEPGEQGTSHFVEMERMVVARRACVPLWLAGDRHHYRRHEERNPNGTTSHNVQRITSGGGGAFLFPTHRPVRRNVVMDRREFVQKTRFPSGVTSFRLSWLNLAFAAKNWKLGLFPLGVLYWLLTWVPRSPDWPTTAGVLRLFDAPGVLLWMFVILIGFVVYADPASAWFRWVGGLTHGLVQVLTAVIVTGVVNVAFLAGVASTTDRVAAHLLNFAAGAILGPTILGLYLLVSLNVFGRHGLEAFSSLRIQDYKHFLRLHVDARGRLEIFPIALRKVPRDTDGHARYMLIEGPIVITPDDGLARRGGRRSAADVEVRT